MNHRDLVTDFLAHASGQSHRDDPALPTTGGPAGNSRLTAWLGIVLLFLFIAELVTLLDVRSLVSWHVALGVALIPPALLKTGSVIWRFARYYTGNRAYRRSGPPPLALRVLGPLVVISTLGVLGSGLALILLGPEASRHAVTTIGGEPLDALSVHKATFVVWLGATGVHTLGRLVPALKLTFVAPGATARVPGGVARVLTIALALAVAGVSTALALSVVDPWHSIGPSRDRYPGHARPF